MKTTNNTILITGGSAGIGFEMAKLFSENGSQVIITGRNQERMAQAISKLKNTSPIVSDVNNAGDVDKLVAQLNKDFPRLNVVINNAGSANYYDMPGKPSGFNVRRILGKGDLWITEYTITYQGRSAYTVSIMEFRNGKVVHETQYFADPFGAPAWRSQWVQQIA